MAVDGKSSIGPNEHHLGHVIRPAKHSDYGKILSMFWIKTLGTIVQTSAITLSMPRSESVIRLDQEFFASSDFSDTADAQSMYIVSTLRRLSVLHIVICQLHKWYATSICYYLPRAALFKDNMKGEIAAKKPAHIHTRG